MIDDYTYSYDADLETIISHQVDPLGVGGCGYDSSICNILGRLFIDLGKLAAAHCNTPGTDRLINALCGATNAVISELNSRLGTNVPTLPCSRSSVCSAFLGLCTIKKSICVNILKLDPDCISC